MWLADKIRRVLGVFDSEEHQMTDGAVESSSLTEKDISEPIITFAAEVEANPSRFELHTVNEEESWGLWGRTLNFKKDYILIDKKLKCVFLFNGDRRREEVTNLSASLVTIYRGKGFTIQGEDLSWVTWDEWDYLSELFRSCTKKRGKLNAAKTKRKEANQRRKMRKLYETK